MKLRFKPMKFLLFSVLSLFVIAPFIGCDAGPVEKKIIFVTNGNDPFWDAADAGFTSEAKKLGISASFEVNNGTEEGQIQKLQQYANRIDIAGIAISVTKADNPVIAEELRKLQDAGIKVLCVDSDLEKDSHDARFAYIGTNNVEAGEELGKAVALIRPDGGKFVTFVGIKEAQNAIERVQGVTTGAGEKFEFVDNMGDNMDESIARTNVEAALSKNTEVKTLVGIWSYNGPAIVDILDKQTAENRKEFTVVTFDAHPNSVQGMKDGKIDALMVQDPFKMGVESVRLLKAMIEDDKATIEQMLPNKGQEGGDIFVTGLKLVLPTKELKEEYIESGIFGKNTQILSLEEFTAWMKEYNLQSS